MKTKILGESTPNKQFKEWHEFKDIFIPFIGKNFSVTVEDDLDPNDIDEVMSNILRLNNNDKTKLQAHLFINYQSMVEAVGIEDVGCSIKSAESVWEYCDLLALWIKRRPYGNQKIYAQFSGGCDWEEEHGLTVSYLEGKILSRVSQHDGHLTYSDAYDVPEEKDQIDG